VMSEAVFHLTDQITLIPVIHGSGDMAVEVRRRLLAGEFDCLAVPLPENFQSAVEAAVVELPRISAVAQRERREDWSSGASFDETDFAEDSEGRDGDDADLEGAGSDGEFGDEPDDLSRINFVPIDPCQPVIAALRWALEERLPRAFIDLPTNAYRAESITTPDAYALKRVAHVRFSAAVLPTIPLPRQALHRRRIAYMASRLHELARFHQRIVVLCAYWEWPWLRDAFRAVSPHATEADAATAIDWTGLDREPDDVEPVRAYPVAPRTYQFALGELPFITGLYERARSELEADENLSIDGVKELLLAAREKYQATHGKRARTFTPQVLRLYLKYVRNLSLIERRFTPDLYTLITAARQIMGDQFAIALAETSREYPVSAEAASHLVDEQAIEFGVDRALLPDGDVVRVDNRLAGPPLVWRSLQLNTRPTRAEQQKWDMQWNPYMQCSWPPEDAVIERFRTHLKDKALALLGTDLARTEKFTSSLMDGLDIRETLRNWHTGELYVKNCPPARGHLDCVAMLFDSPADPRDYPWRTTWIAEHHDESTLALFATDFHSELVGPGIGVATYGGALFLFPPRPVIDIWTDPRLDFTTTLEERLLAGGCLNSTGRYVAVLSDAPPGAGFRRMAKRFGKKLIHIPLAHFSAQMVQQLRLVHVLNGRQVRSYAARFIRKA
jgi:hypothetical protein